MVGKAKTTAQNVGQKVYQGAQKVADTTKKVIGKISKATGIGRKQRAQTAMAKHAGETQEQYEKRLQKEQEAKDKQQKFI